MPVPNPPGCHRPEPTTPPRATANKPQLSAETNELPERPPPAPPPETATR
eukprot:CAMPEP_0204337104 /NCGR_PEP_ID=MMETSP0469-20131031/20054_1 /ASSEMBLY_ACC=CAM_ASM_000384 /TAXON_ID=2969 /ORGANISM="Oxyrrhis marina" /LENGTH=49 /DNA_ID= /DNA_START= /DNA_END= /DNA_ORIENTATION=